MNAFILSIPKYDAFIISYFMIYMDFADHVKLQIKPILAHLISLPKEKPIIHTIGNNDTSYYRPGDLNWLRKSGDDVNGKGQKLD
ncbi:hypothetical protein DERF_007066 [Dermatophagoides farinae]|uniref:Uncharacterized protein n=1 Tax=Dermatophagoides farinae TaxID=6954 RepID=A0A922HZR5_DERFA|nr:hypothetical protein DERF_007066 [Dermatophagoides farinae]